jgi:signal transduction histidine kinase/CheY-like chemotaxis protein
MKLLTHPRSLRSWLGWLVIIGVLPAWAATFFVIVTSYQRERATLEESTIETSRALVGAIERDLGGAEAALNALALSPDLATGDIAAFYRHAREVVKSQIGNGIVLADTNGQQLLSTLRPYGAPLPRSGVRDLLRTIAVSGKPAVSNFYIGATSHEPQVAVGVPVLRAGRVAYVLTMGIRPSRLGELLGQQKLPQDWIVSVFDQGGTIVARSRRGNEFVGKKGTPALLLQIAQTPEGIVETSTLEGIPVVASFSRSKLSGWSVAIGIPVAALTSELRRELWLSVAAAIALFLFGLFLARLISLRIARSIQALNEPAMALATGARVIMPAAEIEEVNKVGNALKQAGALLKERQIAREEAEEAERRMVIAKETAEQSNQAKSQFLTMMSHELRTPLNAVLGFSQLIDAEFYGPLNAKQKEFVDAILSSGNQLLELINDVLELSKIETGRMTVSLERVELVPLIKSVVASLGPSAEKAGIEIEAGNFGADMPAVHADRVRLAQCLLNFGTNAIKYNRPNGAVTVTCKHEGDFVRICVRDTGIGIPPERQSELFQPFNRLGAEQKAIEGTGIGLSLTRRLIELMGGKIGFMSTFGAGSKFWIDIPVYKATAQEHHASAVELAPARRLISGVSILYVEDNPANLILMRNLLAAMPGVSLFEATTGAAGLAAAKLHRPDLIILDINLPDINGVALLKLLKSVPELMATPVLALSANAMPRDVKIAKQAGFFDYVTKPLDVKGFIASVDAALASAVQHQGERVAPPGAAKAK